MDIQFSRREQAEWDFIDSLMAFNSTGLGPKVKLDYADAVERRKAAVETTKDVGGIINTMPSYQFAAFFERHNHAMMFDTTLDILAGHEKEILAWLDHNNKPDALGRLELNPELGVPKYYENIEIHTQPGSYHGSPFAGLMYHWMIGPFLVHRDDEDGMGWALANAVPKRNYTRVLDLGCGIGKSTFPYCDLFPGAEVVGIDYAAPMIKYGHKLAEQRRKKVTFSQRLAEDTGYDDESYDLIVALWLFHEIPNPIANAVVKEAYRLLKPGGVFALMEGPPYKELEQNHSPLSAFMLDSTGKRMNDPYLPGFFKRDRVEMISSGGFEKAYDKAVNRELAAEASGKKNLFGPYPWWVSIGEKAE